MCQRQLATAASASGAVLGGISGYGCVKLPFGAVVGGYNREALMSHGADSTPAAGFAPLGGAVDRAPHAAAAPLHLRGRAGASQEVGTGVCGWGRLPFREQGEPALVRGRGRLWGACSGPRQRARHGRLTCLLNAAALVRLPHLALEYQTLKANHPQQESRQLCPALPSPTHCPAVPCLAPLSWQADHGGGPRPGRPSQDVRGAERAAGPAGAAA